nr:hypothetical protein [Tanacetum cinerariifolium]
MTSVITREALYEELDWLYKQISFICAITGEELPGGLNGLKNISANKHYLSSIDGRTLTSSLRQFIAICEAVFIGSYAKVHLIEESITSLTNYICYLEMTSVITREALYEELDWLYKQISFICAITGEEGLHSLWTSATLYAWHVQYYLFYCRVPNEAEYTVGYGYHQIQDQSKGGWESTKCLEVFPCNLSDHITRLGEEQGFCYKPLNQTKTNSCRKMVMFGLADVPHQK